MNTDTNPVCYSEWIFKMSLNCRQKLIFELNQMLFKNKPRYSETPRCWMKENNLKDYIPHNSIYTAFLKRQEYNNEHRCELLGIGCREKISL